MTLKQEKRSVEQMRASGDLKRMPGRHWFRRKFEGHSDPGFRSAVMQNASKESGKKKRCDFDPHSRAWQILLLRGWIGFIIVA